MKILIVILSLLFPVLAFSQPLPRAYPDKPDHPFTKAFALQKTMKGKSCADKTSGIAKNFSKGTEPYIVDQTIGAVFPECATKAARATKPPTPPYPTGFPGDGKALKGKPAKAGETKPGENRKSPGKKVEAIQ